MNIKQAALLAMKRAVEQLSLEPQLLLIDGTVTTIGVHIPVVGIVKGDGLSVSIAAASILAKVHRDGIMQELDKREPNYGFAQHKGYGSTQHLEALEKLGATKHHRAGYAPVARVLTKS